MGQHKNLVIRSSLCNRNVVTYHSIDHDRHHKNGKTYALYFCPDGCRFYRFAESEPADISPAVHSG